MISRTRSYHALSDITGHVQALRKYDSSNGFDKEDKPDSTPSPDRKYTIVVPPRSTMSHLGPIRRLSHV